MKMAKIQRNSIRGIVLLAMKMAKIQRNSIRGISLSD